MSNIKRISYEVRGDVYPFIMQITELDDVYHTEEEDRVNVIIPLGAEKDQKFRSSLGKAETIEEVKDICDSWVNV